MSSLVDYTDRATCVLFGDGAGAVLVEATEEENVGVQNSYLRTDGKGLPFLHMKAGGSVCPPSRFTVDHRHALPLSGGSYRVPLCGNRHEQRRDEDHGDEQPQGRGCKLGNTSRGKPPYHRGV